MENITVKDIVKATRGYLLCGDENTAIKDICINSREIKPGDLFVPLIGERVDAHRFIESAMEIGAATLTSEHNNVVISDRPFIRVDDTLKALQDIGAYIRDKYDIPFVGVTGSVGKTTTREMITAAINMGKKCFHTEGNQNSQIGVALTLAGLKSGYDAAVIEMGISEEGQMDILSSMVKPHICVVTVIGVAHIEFLGSKENIRKEKLKIISGMDDDGILILNGDDAMLDEVKNDMPCKTITYGLNEKCDFFATDIHMEDYMTVFNCTHESETVEVRMNVLGRHNVRNALAGIAAAYQLGISMETSCKAFEHFEGQRQRIIRHENRYTIFDDTYNASPDSMIASIDVLCDMDCKGKKYAVLGDMLELGEDSVSYHRQIGKYLADKKIDRVITIGERANDIKNALDECEGKYAGTASFTDNAEAAISLMAELTSDDIILIKGSNSMNLNEIVNILAN